MSSIPEEIYIDILLRLPVKSTLVCKCVCKNWYALISDPEFVKLRHSLTIQKTDFNFMISYFDFSKARNVFYSVSYDPLSVSSNEFYLYGVEVRQSESLDCVVHRLVGSCNGLFCIWNREKELFGLLNPDSKEYKELPKSPNKPLDKHIFSCAFGYDYNSGDYKVICLYDDNVYGYLVDDVYSTGPNSWKNSTQVIPYAMLRREESGVLVDRVFHWLGRRTDNFSDVIISLDISSETVRELQPPRPLENNQLVKNLGVLKKCLCILAYGVNVEVWLMQDYGVQESWTRHYTITHERIVKDHDLKPMWSFSSEEILFESSDCYHTQTDLVLYDPKDGGARKPNLHVENQRVTFPKLMATIFLKA